MSHQSAHPQGKSLTSQFYGRNTIYSKPCVPGRVCNFLPHEFCGPKKCSTRINIELKVQHEHIKLSLSPCNQYNITCKKKRHWTWFEKNGDMDQQQMIVIHTLPNLSSLQRSVIKHEYLTHITQCSFMNKIARYHYYGLSQVSLELKIS